MSLVETHRLRLTTQYNRWLVGYLVLALGIHAAAAVGIARWNLPWLAQVKPPTQAPIPLDFVDLDALSQSVSPQSVPSQTNKQAQTNSTAARTAQPNQPIQAGAAPRISAPQAASPIVPLRSIPPLPTQPSLQSRQAQNRQPLPAVRPSYENNPTAVSVQPSPSVALPAENSASASEPTLASERPSASPPNPAPTVDSAAQLGAPQTLSLEGIGLGNRPNGNRPNANRVGSGNGVDATEDVTWGSYLSGLNRLIDQHWQRVAVSATRRTRIQFRVNRQGQLTDWNLLESSGDTAADQAAIQAVRAAAPFAPLPQNATEQVLIVNFTFTQWLSPAPSPN